MRRLLSVGGGVSVVPPVPVPAGVCVGGGGVAPAGAVNTVGVEITGSPITVVGGAILNTDGNRFTGIVDDGAGAGAGVFGGVRQITRGSFSGLNGVLGEKLPRVSTVRTRKNARLFSRHL